jgi:hypothetical protein
MLPEGDRYELLSDYRRALCNWHDVGDNHLTHPLPREMACTEAQQAVEAKLGCRNIRSADD